jgi:hypothetical protein
VLFGGCRYGRGVARIVLEPAPMELGVHRDEYDVLVEALTAEGHVVQLVEPEERRSVPGAEIAVDLVVYVFEHGKDLATDALLLELGRRLRGRRRRRAEVRRRSEPPREVDLPGPVEE